MTAALSIYRVIEAVVRHRYAALHVGDIIEVKVTRGHRRRLGNTAATTGDLLQ